MKKKNRSTSSLRGMKMQVVSDVTRPTTSRVKESLFNLIRFELDGSSFLELFAGTAQISFEAINSGAKCGVCVENNSKAAEQIRKKHLLLRDSLAKSDQSFTLIESDATKALHQLNLNKDRFDWCFIDPPYVWWKDNLAHLPLFFKNLGEVIREKIIIEISYGDADQVVQWESALQASSHPWRIKKIYRYGSSALVSFIYP